MRTALIIPILSLLAAPLAVAQTAAKQPLIVFDETAPAAKPATPKQAVIDAAENTTGMHVDTPATPQNPPSPSNPTNNPKAGSPANPVAPESPQKLADKLWPRDTLQIFLPSCTGFRPQFVAPCTCVITKLIVEMPHDEFLTKNEAGTIEDDARLKRIRSECVTTPQRKD